MAYHANGGFNGRYDRQMKPLRSKAQQNWTIGARVSVGFVHNLLVLHFHNHGPNNGAWLLRSNKGQHYLFTPHQGLERCGAPSANAIPTTPTQTASIKSKPASVDINALKAGDVIRSKLYGLLVIQGRIRKGYPHGGDILATNATWFYIIQPTGKIVRAIDSDYFAVEDPSHAGTAATNTMHRLGMLKD